MLQWRHQLLSEDKMKKQSLEGDKYLLDQYKKELAKENILRDETQKKEQSYKKQAKIMTKVQVFSIMGIFGSLVAIVFLLATSQIIIPILVGLIFLAATILTSIEKYNDQQLIVLVGSHLSEIQGRIDYLDVEIEKLQNKIDKNKEENEKNSKVEKVQAFLLYTPKNKQTANKENKKLEDEANAEETFVS